MVNKVEFMMPFHITESIPLRMGAALDTTPAF